MAEKSEKSEKSEKEDVPVYGMYFGKEQKLKVLVDGEWRSVLVQTDTYVPVCKVWTGGREHCKTAFLPQPKSVKVTTGWSLIHWFLDCIVLQYVMYSILALRRNMEHSTVQYGTALGNLVQCGWYSSDMQ